MWHFDTALNLQNRRAGSFTIHHQVPNLVLRLYFWSELNREPGNLHKWTGNNEKITWWQVDGVFCCFLHNIFDFFSLFRVGNFKCFLGIFCYSGGEFLLFGRGFSRDFKEIFRGDYHRYSAVKSLGATALPLETLEYIIFYFSHTHVQTWFTCSKAVFILHNIIVNVLLRVACKHMQCCLMFTFMHVELTFIDMHVNFCKIYIFSQLSTGFCYWTVL